MTNRGPADVAAVIPAYNAQETLAATIASVRAQSFRDLEIIIVDDGSRDATRAIAEEACRSDPRIRILSQANAGVAAARNLGWQSTSAPFVAFVDADDLWAADKIERQMAALEQGGPDTGLAYTWYAMIDQRGRVIYKSEPVHHEGDVLDAILADNFIGNGSAPLVRRNVLMKTGGFDPALRDHDAQGCEDWQFYCRAAAVSGFAVVPDHLVGYRQLPDAMSADLPRMLRSWLLVTDEMLERHPGKREALRRGLLRCNRWLTNRAVDSRRFATIPHLAATIAPRSALMAARMLAIDLPMACAKAARYKLLPSPAATSPDIGTDRFPLGELYRD